LAGSQSARISKRLFPGSNHVIATAGNFSLVEGGLFMRSVKPLAFFAALVAMLAGLGAAVPAAGNTTSVTATASGTNAFNVIASYTNSPAGVPATLTAVGTGGFTSASASGAVSVTAAGFVSGSKTVTTTADTSGATTDVITIQAVFTCQAAGQVTFTLTQTGGTPATSSSTPMTCTGAGTGGTNTGGLTVTPASAAPGQQVTISGTCQMGASLIANPPAGQFVQASVNGQPAQPNGGGIACSTAGTLTAIYICSQQTQVTFTLGASTGTLSCGAAAGAQVQYPYGQQPYPGQQPYTGQQFPNVTQANQGGVNTNGANASNSNSPVSIQVSPSTVGCGSTASISVSARGPDGQSINQGNVNLYTTSGAIEPKSGAVTNGKFDTKFTAPSIGGTATISANVAGVTNSVDVKVDCAAGSSSTSSPSTLNTATNSLLNSPASPPPPPAAAPLISPPSTGDGGLLSVLGD
jgi:hypothetical protein